MDALKKSGAVPVEIVAGRRRIKPSNKAKRAAGIYSSDEESDGEAENTNVKTGSKRKSGKSDVNSISKKPGKAPKTNQPRKRARVDSDDAESTDEDEDNAGDQADAYERLRLERETDRPVFARINFAYYLLLTSTFRSKEAIVLVVMILAQPTFAPSSLPRCTLCQTTRLRKAIGVKFASKITFAFLVHFSLHLIRLRKEPKIWLTGSISTLRKHIKRYFILFLP